MLSSALPVQVEPHSGDQAAGKEPGNGYNGSISPDKVEERLGEVGRVVEHFVRILGELKSEAIVRSGEIGRLNDAVITSKARTEANFEDIGVRFKEIEQSIVDLKVCY